jgi:microcystin-dependent protein
MLRNFVEEAANAPGTASVVQLNGAPAGRRSWRASGYASGAAVFYEIADTTQFEWGVGVFTQGTPDTITRTTVLGNSNGTTARLNFGGACRVYNEIVAERAVYIANDGAVSADAGMLSKPLWGGTATGTADALNVSVSPAPAALVAGLQVAFLASAINTGPTTLNLNGLGALPLQKKQADWTTNLGPGDLANDNPVHVVFDGTNWRMLSPPRSAEMPVGALVDFTSNILPSGYLFADGRNVSRTGYPRLHALYALDGYPYGAGDGSTTFGIPDARGRVTAGKDAGANRITVGISGINAALLGAAGGSEYLQSHNHGLTDPGHAHGITDGGHNHTINNPAHTHGITDPWHGHGVTDPGHAHGLSTQSGAAGPNINADFLVTSIVSNTTGALASDAAATGLTVNAGPSNITVNAATTGIWSDGAFANLGINGAFTGMSVQNAGGGGSQNMPPTLVVNKLVYAGA